MEINEREAAVTRRTFADYLADHSSRTIAMTTASEVRRRHPEQ